MKTNQKILRIGISFIILIMLISIAFTYYIRCDKPVFLRYCVEVSVPSKNSSTLDQPFLQLGYITNVTDKKSVVGISFQEATKIEFMATENNSNITFSPYQKKMLIKVLSLENIV